MGAWEQFWEEADLIPASSISKKTLHEAEKEDLVYTSLINKEGDPSAKESLKDTLSTIKKTDKYQEYPKKIRPFIGPPGVGGYVAPSESDVANLNTYGKAFPPEETLVHEGQHLKDYKNQLLEKYLSKNLPLSDEYDSDSLIPFLSDLKKKGEYEKYSLADDFVPFNQEYKVGEEVKKDVRPRGFFSELARIESTLPPGKGIQDTDIGKEIFSKYPELRPLYQSGSAPNNTTQMTEWKEPESKYSLKSIEERINTFMTRKR